MKRCQKLQGLGFLAASLVASAGAAAFPPAPLPHHPAGHCAAAPADTVSDTAMRLALLLKSPIEQGLLEVEAVDRYVVIRIGEQNAFAPGAVTLRPAILPALAALRRALKEVAGTLSVAGYSDDVAISTPQLRSNWEFAASRAAAVLHELMKTGELAADRFTLVSYGPIRPLVPNTSAENRARNRRVEIVIRQ